MEFDAQQLLFEAFFDIMLIFGRVEPNVNLLPIFVHYNISKIAIFQDPSSTRGGDKHVSTLTFLYGIQCSITFT